MNDEQLDYVSSSPLLATASVAKSRDEDDRGTLDLVLKLVNNRIEYYLSIDSLDAESKLSISSQLVSNKAIVRHLRELHAMLVNAIQEVDNG